MISREDAVRKAMLYLIPGVAVTATVFLTPTLVVRATRRRWQHVRGPRGLSRQEYRVTIGRPNYQTKQWIKDLVKAKEPFPVKGVRLTFGAAARPVRRAATRKVA